ncbi:MAG: ABC transporter substrate-binding protein [Proteobacteria bacterium]|nr:ABC transporter substrate-binding protein [Pseudomonadota bacterium]
MKKLFTAVLALAALGLVAGSASAQMKKVRIGTEGAYPPFNSIDSDGKLVGFDIDIANALCKAANFDCEFVVQDWDGMIPGLLAKKYDAIIASMSITEERKKKVDFTAKYYNTPAKFVAPKGKNLTVTPEGLKGMSVAVQRATTHENFLRDNFPGLDIRVYATQDEANADLVAGRVDLGHADSVALMEGFINTDAGKDFEFVGPDYNVPQWHGTGAGIAVRKGSDELRMALDKAIDEIRADGTYQKINAKYFDFDVFGD